MFRLSNLGRLAALGTFGALVALAACESTRDFVAPPTPPTAANPIFQSYVAIGNSITAGFQSNGINDSTQRQSFAAKLATQMNTYYRFPGLAMPGCTAPIANDLTGTLVTTGTPAGATPAACSGRTFNTDTSEILTNVAVPGARVLDPISVSTVASNTLTNIILRGRTQVEQALRAKPTFVSIWIGNNDVLQAGVTGLLTPTPGISPGIVSTQTQFQTSYDAMIAQLLAGAPGLKGVLIGVVKVSGVPVLSTGDTLSKSAAAKAFINAATGKTVTIDANCTGSTTLLNLPLLVSNIKSGALPAYISCVKNVPQAGLGEVFVLDPAEQTQLNGVIDGYNNYIAAKAATIGFAYFDPNPLLAAQRATNAIPRLPNFTGPTAATTAFGTLISLDGIHPADAGHRLIANGIIPVINTKYGTTLALVP
jgi:lysophospholipase L1-like esterase